MDELVIEDKKYLSSKKAAKLTGYAKDYVGQLCREGKVEARLVGRNWYVLEDSIMDHRFGSIADVKADDNSSSPIPTPETTEEAKNGLEYKWSSPVYTTESYSSLPTEVPQAREEMASSQIPAREEPTSPQVLNDMQSAWQEWFDKQKEAEKMLPDASEMLLEEADEIVPLAVVEKEEESVHIIKQTSTNFEVQEQPTQFIEEPEEETIIPIRHVVDSHNERRMEREEYVPISRERRESIVRPEYRATIQSTPVYRAEKRVLATKKKGKGAFLLKVTILSIAAIFMAITYLAFSSKDIAEGGEANTLINFLTGVSTIQIQK